MNRRLQRSLLLRAILLLSLSLIGFACSKNKDAGKPTATRGASHNQEPAENPSISQPLGASTRR